MQPAQPRPVDDQFLGWVRDYPVHVPEITAHLSAGLGGKFVSPRALIAVAGCDWAADISWLQAWEIDVWVDCYTFQGGTGPDRQRRELLRSRLPHLEWEFFCPATDYKYGMVLEFAKKMAMYLLEGRRIVLVDDRREYTPAVTVLVLMFCCQWPSDRARQRVENFMPCNLQTWPWWSWLSGTVERWVQQEGWVIQMVQPRGQPPAYAATGNSS